MKYIAYSPDDKYVNQTVVSMQSAYKHNNDVEFIILYSKLSETSIDKLKSTGATIRFINVDEKLFSSLTLSDWVTVQAWFRILLPDVCPDLSKVLYLDCDTLVIGDLTELFNIDLSDKFLAGVKDVWGVNRYVKRLNMTSDVYINSGMLLFNCDFCRKEKFLNKVLDFAKNNFKIIQFCDQDSINKIVDEKKVVLLPKYNFMDTWWRNGYYEFDGQEEINYLEAGENPVIIHFTGPKPAFKGCGNKFNDIWWNYAKLTQIYQELLNEYNDSSEPIEKISLLKQIFSIKNEYNGKLKTKVLTILGQKIILKKS